MGGGAGSGLTLLQAGDVVEREEVQLRTVPPALHSRLRRGQGSAMGQGYGAGLAAMTTGLQGSDPITDQGAEQL